MPSPIPVQSPSPAPGAGLVDRAAAWTTDTPQPPPETRAATSVAVSSNDAAFNAMSPEEEQSSSPVTGVIAGRDEEERRLTSPPSGSKFDAVQQQQQQQRSGRALQPSSSSDAAAESESWANSSDVEKFDGKIVYNPDGSAYIIEDNSELSEDDGGVLLDLPSELLGTGSIVDGRGVNLSQAEVFPQIANAFYVSRSGGATAAGGGYGGGDPYRGERPTDVPAAAALNRVFQDKKIVPDVPVMHSYRVYTVRDRATAAGAVDCGTGGRPPQQPSNDCSTVPVKPILMCFICKLSFGYAKSFVAHATGEHGVTLQEDEYNILGHKNASAIVQCVGKEKEPLVSFLEPLALQQQQQQQQSSANKAHAARIASPSSSAAHKVPNAFLNDGNRSSDGGGGDMQKSCPESLVVHRRNSACTPPSSSCASSPSVNTVPETSVSLPQSGSPRNNVNSFSLSNKTNNNCSSNNSNKVAAAVGGRPPSVASSSAASNVYDCIMDLTRKSPISALAVSSGTSARSNSASPGASPSPGTTLSPQLISGVPLSYPQPPPNFMTGTTIGVCPDHMNGRPSGVDCGRCELILSSSRLGGVGGSLVGMHSRNSCKTLKCPKCNWHYKYQETLEIHMKEKHPESETSCVYCIAGQPHPRLARGETYTCGYKPYRCEVCNYSTTTKGNLSIHMQSDKHLNNMQELQNGGGVASAEMQQRHQAASPSQQHSKQPASSSSSSAMSPGAGGQQQQQQHPAMNMGPMISQKPKPTFRCEVCNYETNVARNLRIHMTSEKHTHNIMVLQQSVKHMQTLNALQTHHHQQQINFESLMHFHPGLTLPGDKPPPHTEAALADMAYNQALLIQMMTGGQMPPHFSSATGDVSPHVDADVGLNPDTMEPPPEPVDKNPDYMFQCSTCAAFVTDSLEALSHHLAADRTKVREQEILTMVGGNYICNLCTYKTNLKANFQLHCKTDKHLQRLQHVNHVKEGGPHNEWKLKYMSSPGGVQVRCNACDYYTNSTHKLQLHCSGQRHEAASLLFRYLRDNDAAAGGEAPSVYHCLLCEFSSRDKLPLLQHVRTVKHMQMEQLHQMQRRSDGKDIQTDINMVFQVTAAATPHQSMSVDSDQEQDRENKTDGESHHNMSVDTMKAECSESDSNRNSPKMNDGQEHLTEQKKNELYCPLCQDVFEDLINFEKHLMNIHSVNSEGLQRLLSLVNQSHWLNSSKSSQPSPPLAPTSPPSPDALDKCNDRSEDVVAPEQDADENKCPTCQKICRNIDDLCQHQNETGHVEIKQTPNGPGYLCWKKGCNMYFTTVQNLHIHYRESHAGQQNILVSEKHVYKYRCNQCSLAFKTLDKLQAHSQYHAIRDLTKCVLCRRSFRTVATFQKHLQTAHPDLAQADLEALKQNSTLLFEQQSADEKMDVDDSVDDEEDCKDECEPECGENSGDDSVAFKQQQLIEDYMNGQTLAEDGYNDSERKYKCHRCKVAFTNQKYLTHHNKTLLHRKGEKQTYPMEKYLDPNRPFKCEVCKESFTQKNILLVHYNSVLHLHKLKRSMQEQQQQLNNNNAPIVSNNSSYAVAAAKTSAGSASEDDDKKPYKCNICKVAYTQGSTLDIHMRSVLHQTRASKLHDLALAGQVDLTKPIIEQPEQSSRPPSQNRQDAESQASGKDEPVPLPLQPPHLKGNQLSCQRCNALFSNQEQLNTHQQLYCMFSAPMSMLPMNPALQAFAANNLSNAAQGPKSPSQQQQSPLTLTEEQLLKVPLALQGKKHSHMYKLLESYGFDLVMQFNENHQKRKENEKLLQELTAQMAMEQQANAVKEEMAEINEEETCGDLPEVAKSTCVHCNKEFSSVWVLKAHCEEVHKDLVPFDFLEKYAKQIKCEIEKKGNEPQLVVANRVDSPTDEDVSVKTENEQDAETQAESSDFAMAGDQQSGAAANIPLSVAQHLNDMQAAFNAMAASQLTQQLQQFNPMMVASMAGLGMGLPLGLNMQALAAMNLQPPLVPMMMPPPNFESIMSAGSQQNAIFQQQPAAIDPTGILAKQQQLLQQQQQVQQNSQQKRARTRITDDQLKILRAHFDINNSPSEDQIQEMASQSGLPPKVIKHWFRNTLFKERQRNKDSPYNFNNPPSTTLNLEEYEKTGEAKVMPLLAAQAIVENADIVKEAPKTPTFAKKKPLQTSTPNNNAVVRAQSQTPTFPQQQTFSQNFSRQFNSQPIESPIKLEPQIKSELKDTETSQLESKFPWGNPESPAKRRDSIEEKQNLYLHHDRGSPLDLNAAENLTLSSILTSQHQEINMSNAISASNMLPPKLSSSSFTSPPQMSVTTQSGPRSISPGRSPNSSDGFPHSIMMNQGSGGSGGSTSSGKRANRTRFTDCQIKVLQEFFENNAYPKDDDLEYLSKLLNLSPRVIVVWFQNARQKARKVYENQPAVEPAPGIIEEGSNRFQRTPGLNYQCNKCLLVFQRYYELIRHQKTHCFKEEDAKRSAQAQAAAAHIAAALSSEDSNSSTVENHPGQSANSNPMTPTPTSTYPTSPNQTASLHDKENAYNCDHCNLVFTKLDQWKEHQQVHIMNPNLFPTYHPESAFGILQQQAQLHQQQQQQLQQQQSQSQQMSGTSEMNANPTSLILSMMQQNSKRSFDEFDDHSDKETEFTKDKRLRTTILPEQLDYLYQKYQIESNPSRKMLESIAQEVGLKKRVVQVWFQNTRARERKGQFRAHSQAINKRCPFCSAIFKIKSALESHLQTKHPEQCSRGYINVDNIPDEDVSMDSFASSQMSEIGQKNQTYAPNPYYQNVEDVENLGKMYQESLKRYMEEMQQSSMQNGGLSSEGGGGVKTKSEGEIPLDLSKPIDARMDNEQDDDDDSMSECTDIMDDESPVSPASSTQSGQQRVIVPGGSQNNKRYRTQMSNVQVKVMKALFDDYKTPTMGECEMLGREIGLAKRVVQVWFQNARAKEKKYKLQTKQNPELTGPPDECKYCRFKYTHKYSVQDHIFTSRHIALVKQHVESRMSVSDMSGNCSDNDFTVPSTPAAGDPHNNNLQPNQQVNQLQMLQLAGLIGQSPVAQAVAMATIAKLDGKDQSQMTAEELALLPHLYNLGVTFQQGFMHPGTAMMTSPAGASNAATNTTTNGMRAAVEPQQRCNASMTNSNASTGTMTTAAGPQDQQQQAGGGGVTGTPVRMLQLEPSVIHAIAERCRSVRPDQTAVVEVAATVPAAELPAEGYAIDGGRTVGHACAKCQLAFPDNGGLAAHQQRECRTTGAVALAHPAYGCRSCGVGANGETNTYGTVHALRAHIETAHRAYVQQQQQHGRQQLQLQQPAPNLSDEMEDVVNQITALAAAKAVGRRSPSPRDPNSDSNANLFCAPDKKSAAVACTAATNATAAAAAKMHNKFVAPPANVAPAVPSGGQ